MGHARGAAAVRLAKMEPEPEVAVAQVRTTKLLAPRYPNTTYVIPSTRQFDNSPREELATLDINSTSLISPPPLVAQPHNHNFTPWMARDDDE